MSSPQVLMPDHLSDETLAAYVDGRLAPSECAPVEQHLAACSDCYAVWQSVAEFQALEMAAEQENVVRGGFGRFLSGFAIAAALAVVFWVSPLRKAVFHKDPMNALVASANAEEVRPFQTRVSGKFAYKKPFAGTRGQEPESPTPHAAGAAHVVVADASATRRDRGIAYLFLGEPRDAAQAFTDELLAETGKTDVDAAIAGAKDAELLDLLSAAWIEAGEYETALRASNRAIALDPSPRFLFNRALAMQFSAARAQDFERAGDAAIRAWEEYIRVETDADWRGEAQDRLKEFKNLLKP